MGGEVRRDLRFRLSARAGRHRARDRGPPLRLRARQRPGRGGLRRREFDGAQERDPVRRGPGAPLQLRRGLDPRVQGPHGRGIDHLERQVRQDRRRVRHRKRQDRDGPAQGGGHARRPCGDRLQFRVESGDRRRQGNQRLSALDGARVRPGGRHLQARRRGRPEKMNHMGRF